MAADDLLAALNPYQPFGFAGIPGNFYAISGHSVPPAGIWRIVVQTRQIKKERAEDNAEPRRTLRFAQKKFNTEDTEISAQRAQRIQPQINTE
jgi:hypothetical protein